MKKKISLISIITAALIIAVSCKSVNVSKTIPDQKNGLSVTGPDTVLHGNSVKESGIVNISDRSGLFMISMSGYKGELFIGIADDRFYGTIKFYNWGNGVPQPLADLKVTKDKIYFKRIIKTKEDLLRYGGTDYFDQDFYGIFTPDKNIIKGYYRYVGTQDNWQAIKK